VIKNATLTAEGTDLLQCQFCSQ